MPVDQHARLAVPRVPLGQDVLIDRADVLGVRADRRRRLPPDLRVAGGERRVCDLDRERADDLGGQEPSADIAQVILGVAMVAGGDVSDPGVRPVGEQHQLQPFGQRVFAEAGAAGPSR
jgi:hypothetical protein